MAEAIYDPTVYAAWTRGRQPAKASVRRDANDSQRAEKPLQEVCKPGDSESSDARRN